MHRVWVVSLVKLFFSFWYTYCDVLYIDIPYKKKKLCVEHDPICIGVDLFFLLCSSKLNALFLMFASSFLFHMVCRSSQGVSNETPRCCRTSILAFLPSSMSLALLLHIWMGKEKVTSINHLFYSFLSEENEARVDEIFLYLVFYLYSFILFADNYVM